jgi:phosphoglycolate phosphatase
MTGMWIVWDWNGTLLDDVDACVSALNDMLSRRSLPNVDREFFRRSFSFPARGFYDRIGLSVPDSEWDALAREYHDAYRSKRFSLNPLARAALDAAKAAGARQGILSALRSDYLADDIERFGIGGYFEKIVGSDNLDGASKAVCAARLGASLAGERTVLVGDSIHDKEAADAMGAEFVAFGGGSHAPERLAPFGPVAATLPDAVALALSLVGKQV